MGEACEAEFYCKCSSVLKYSQGFYCHKQHLHITLLKMWRRLSTVFLMFQLPLQLIPKPNHHLAEVLIDAEAHSLHQINYIQL